MTIRRLFAPLFNCPPLTTITGVIIISLGLTHSSYTGITVGTHLVWNGKHVILFGDTHDAGIRTTNCQQTHDFIRALKETVSERDEKLHILLEKPASYIINKRNAQFRDYENLDILCDIDEELKKNGLTKVTIEDAEIRKVEISAGHILGEKYPDVRHNKGFKFFEHDGPDLSVMTFQDIVDSFESLMTSWTTFKQAYRGDLVLDTLERDVEMATIGMAEFKSLLETNGIKVSDTIQDFTLECGKNRCELYNRLGACIKDVFVTLLDLYLIKRMIEYQGKYLAIIAGGLHTSSVSNLLRSQNNHIELAHCCSESRKEEYNFQIRLLSKSELLLLLRGASWSYRIREKISQCSVPLFILMGMISLSIFFINQQQSSPVLLTSL